MNFSDFKEILPKDKFIKDFINKNYGDNVSIKYSNTGFVVVPIGSIYIYKYYLPDEYIAFHFQENNQYNLFEKEKINYELFKKNNILIPKYYGYGEEIIGDYKFKYAKLENIRINNKKISTFKEIDIDILVKLISDIHRVKLGYVHGNIHPYNFFLTNQKELGVYNLSSYYKGQVEEDISKICYGYELDVIFIKEFISKYCVKGIKSNILLSKVYELTKLYTYKKEDFLKLVILIKNL